VRDSRSVAWSPDGDWIAFTALSRAANPLIGWDVYRMDPNRHTVKRLVDALFAKFGNGAPSYEQPAWSPDGQWIAACAEAGDHPGIYVIRSDGHTARRLERGCTPAWSPDGQWIAFTRYDSTGHLQIYRMRADGSAVEGLADTPGSTGAPVWSPGGEWLLFAAAGSTGNRVLYRMRPDGSGLEQVTGDHIRELFDWSPDGEWIVYSAISGERSSDLYRVRLDGTGKQRLTDAPGDDFNPSWSSGPDKSFRGGALLALGLALIAAGMYGRRQRAAGQAGRGHPGTSLNT
jgi:Tol biopolymer transport system component